MINLFFVFDCLHISCWSFEMLRYMTDRSLLLYILKMALYHDFHGHSTLCTLHNARYSLHAICKLHTAHYTLHSTHYLQNNLHCTLSIAQCTLPYPVCACLCVYQPCGAAPILLFLLHTVFLSAVVWGTVYHWVVPSSSSVSPPTPHAQYLPVSPHQKRSVSNTFSQTYS